MAQVSSPWEPASNSRFNFGFAMDKTCEEAKSFRARLKPDNADLAKEARRNIEAANAEPKVCGLCGCDELNADWMCPGTELMKCGYPLTKTGLNQGAACHYCSRSGRGLYSHFESLADLKHWLAEDVANQQDFHVKWDIVIVQIATAKNYEVRIVWSAVIATVKADIKQIREKAVEILRDEDGMDYNDYVEKFGSPYENGRGHQVKSVKGETVVIL